MGLYVSFSDGEYMEFLNNEAVLSDLYQPSPELQTDIDLTQPEVEPEPDPIPSTSRDENSVQIRSVVIVSPDPRDPSPLEAPEPVPVADPMIPAIEDSVLDNELLDILGTDPTTEKKYGKDIQKDLSIRFQHWTRTGITKELRRELKENYLTPENAKLIDPPELNAEIKAAVSDIIAKRDKAIESKQKQLTLAITSLGEAITLILSAKEKNTALLKLLMDSTRIICDCQHADSVTRRKFLLNAVKKEVREQLQNTKIDKLLFGENLAETIKTAKAITKSGTDLKPAPAPTPPNKKFTQSTGNTSRNLNWRNPGPTRRPKGPPRMKEPATTSTNQPASSSKQSQHPQQRQNYRRR